MSSALGREGNLRRTVFGWVLPLLLCGLGLVGSDAAGQMPSDSVHSNVPSLPSGTASVHGRIVNRKDPGRAADVPIMLYALSADGSPGLGNTRTDEAGRFAFEGISNDPHIVYLVGARYDEVPYGQRFVFEPGKQSVEIEIPVSEPTTDVSRVRVTESLVKLDWAGSRLLVTQSHRLKNTGEGVVRIRPDERSGHRAAFRGELPEGAGDFSNVQSGTAGGLEQEQRDVRFWGPVYPGEQELRYQYTLPIPDAGDQAALVSFDLRLPDGSGRVTIVVPEDSLKVRGKGLVETGEPMEIEGQRYLAMRHGAVAPGASLSLSVEVPASKDDPDAISISRADIWLDLDDTQLVASVEWSVEIAPPARLRARPGNSLLRFALPEGAEVLRVSPEAVAAGLADSPDGRALELYGPLTPGSLEIAYRYRVPATTAGLDLDLEFPRAVGVLNLLVADNGIAIESDRLHRRRPFRSGTRLYLHREAFQLDPGEVLSLGLRPLHQRNLPRPVAMAAAVGLALLGAGFLVAPLRRRDLREEPERARSERERVYESIRDLDHDFETGKIEAADYETMRSDLRAQAVALLHEERSQAEARTKTPAAPVEAAKRFCPHCGGAAAQDWRFCSHCGGRLA